MTMTALQAQFGALLQEVEWLSETTKNTAR